MPKSRVGLDVGLRAWCRREQDIVDNDDEYEGDDAKYDEV